MFPIFEFLINLKDPFMLSRLLTNECTFHFKNSSFCLLPSQSKLNMESMTKPELLMLFSILEGELEARDLVIEALKVPTIRAADVVITVKWFPTYSPSQKQTHHPERKF